MAEIITIKTPDNILLDGLWLGPPKPEKIYVYIHGLSSSVFSGLELLNLLIDRKTAVLTFNNRGHDKVTRVRKIDKKSAKGYQSLRAGGAHEKFTDCVYDIEGAIGLARKSGAKQILLLGHSTGCQKIAYYLASRPQPRLVKGGILLSPISDYAAISHIYDKKTLNKVVTRAKKMVRERRGHEILPLDIWSGYDDAQRWLSLYTPHSAEEIFTYSQPRKRPVTFRKVNHSLLIVWAQADEFQDRPTS
ncbi:MAG: alpha/beta fold hydrolase [Candidatus Komeilibacteria bacterium]|nr:alpha/beta fold hydrolase [Candidatus Komeilibacteria bacterium]